MLSALLVAASSSAFAQFPSDDPHQTTSGTNSRATPRRPDSSENREPISTAPETTRASSHKTWKELARVRNEEKARTPAANSTRSSTEEKSPETHAHGATLSPLTVVSALAVVICLILVLARIFRRHAPLFSQALPAEALEVLGRRFLDQRQSIVLLRIGSRILVVGSSTAGLQGIGEVSDPVEVDLIAGLCRGSRSGRVLGSSFLSLLTGQSGPPTSARRRSEPPRPPRPPESQEPGRSATGRPPSARLSDPEQELVRRLRGASTAGASQPIAAEVFRE